MLNNLKANKILWVLVAVLSIIASLAGISSKASIYNEVVGANLISGAFGQDLMSLAAGIILFLLALFSKQGSTKKHIVALGLLGYFFYAYGIYVIERAYNAYYLLYMAIFALSFWAMVYGSFNISKELLQKAGLSNRVRVFSLIVAIFQPVVFYPLWISALLPLMRTHNRIESLYSIYILDLCFIMPAFLILAYYLLKEKVIGYLLSPAMFILGFTLIFSLSLSELVKPIFGGTTDIGSLVSSLVLSILFLSASVLHLGKLKTQ